jgi:orotidine-5'-phosphate decarboxylase
MTHPQFTRLEGGSLAEAALGKIINLAIDLGVENFIVPGNKAEKVIKWRRYIEIAKGAGHYALAAPGFVDQGGSITEAGTVAGQFWHPIIGRGVHANKDLAPREAVDFYTKQMQEAA